MSRARAPHPRRAAAPGLVVASRLLAGPDGWIEGGGLVVRGGRVERVLRSAAALRRARRAVQGVLDLGEGCLGPGLVNAHAHLELSQLAGALPARAGFVAWIRALVRARAAAAPAALAAAAARGAQGALASGTTALGDIVSLSFAAGVGAAAGLRVRAYREALDAWDPARTAGALAGLARALPARARRAEGLSPHAPMTTSPALLRGLAALARRRSLPVACHWSESEEELAWLAGQDGPFADLLGRRGPRRSGLDLLEEAGLLRARPCLIHGNLPARGEIARIARAGAVVVHCPGTHRFFGRAPFPWRAYRRAGVALALGTDSLASNEALDLAREMRLLRESEPSLPPELAWEMGTRAAARALGLAGSGELAAGAEADLVLWEVEGRTRRAVLERLTSGRARVLAVWTAGRRRRLGSRAEGP